MTGARWGFTLLEVVVALLIVSVGGLATLGLARTASGRLAEAARIEAAVRDGVRLADSLEVVAGTGAGARETPWGRLSWDRGEGGGRVELTLRPSATRPTPVTRSFELPPP